MPFCSTCGSEVVSGDRFCSNCGALVNNNSVAVAAVNPQASPLAQAEKIRSESLAEMNKMIKYFSLKQSQYDEYDNCVKNLSYLSKPGSRVRINELSVWSLVICGVVIIFAGGFVGLLITFLSGMFAESIIGVIIGLLIILGGLIGGVIVIIHGFANRSKNESEMKKKRAMLIQQNSVRFSELAQELSEYYKNYGYCATGPYYTNPKILSSLKELIVSGRAETIKEAINLMHQEAHNSEMELKAANAASGAMAAAFFTAASFILK